MAQLIRAQHKTSCMGIAGRLERHIPPKGILQMQRRHWIREMELQLFPWHHSIDVQLIDPGRDRQQLETLRQRQAIETRHINEPMDLVKEHRVMNDQIVFEVGQQVISRIKLSSQMTLSLKAKPQWIDSGHRHVSEPFAVGSIELIKHVMAAIGDQVQIDLMAMVQVGRISSLIGKIKMQLMAAQPGKGEDLLT